MPDEREKSSKAEQFLEEWNLMHEKVGESSLLAIMWRAIKKLLSLDDNDSQNKS